MQGVDALSRALRSADGRSYGAYKQIEGAYEGRLGGLAYQLFVDHVQPDPYAPPSRIRLRVPQTYAGFPRNLYNNRDRRVALEDFVLRQLASLAGEGLSVDRPGQEVLEQTAVAITDQFVEARLWADLPARGRTVLGRQAEALLLQALPALAERALCFASLDSRAVRRHVETVEEAAILRRRLPELGLVAFLAEGSILPRRSGVDDRPLPAGQAVPLQVPPSLAVEVELPYSGRCRGLGIPRGVTLIVGGGYHGKSTLLAAVESGVYNHVPGDGRERVVTDAGAVKVRAEDGRSICGVDISPFIANLPFGADTRRFSTANASGSTSQAASIMEALEAGATALLLDEDTSATNFLIRDRRMQSLVAKEHEPITPFIDQVRRLAQEGVSTVLVLGGSGDYLDVADTVLMMDTYRPVDATQQARQVAARFPTGRQSEGCPLPVRPRSRCPLPESFDPHRGSRPVKISTRGQRQIVFGSTTLDLGAVEQIVHPSQTRCLADSLYYLVRRYADGRTPLGRILDRVEEEWDRQGLEASGPFIRGDYARPRRLELAAAINRLRTLRVADRDS
ncbi:MAG: ABC-ATPase domain-containing protein [Firmicutes bacterium]|nr:ABC-ATPase domain-containing protein [Bacillota bacterium]